MNKYLLVIATVLLTVVAVLCVQYDLAERGIMEPVGFKAYGRSQTVAPDELVRQILCSHKPLD